MAIQLAKEQQVARHITKTVFDKKGVDYQRIRADVRVSDTEHLVGDRSLRFCGIQMRDTQVLKRVIKKLNKKLAPHQMYCVSARTDSGPSIRICTFM